MVNNYCFFPSSIGAVLDHIADILSSPGLSTAQDLQTLPEDYKDFDKNFKKFVSNAQNVDSKSLIVKFFTHMSIQSCSEYWSKWKEEIF